MCHIGLILFYDATQSFPKIDERIFYSYLASAIPVQQLNSCTCIPVTSYHLVCILEVAYDHDFVVSYNKSFNQTQRLYLCASS